MRDHGFWQQVIDSGMAVPNDPPLIDLTAELVEMLGSPDPGLRDGLGYEILARWIGNGVYDDLLVSLGDSVSRGLAVGLGETGSDSVFRRSFSSRVLTACLERDNVAHLLPVDVVLRWAEGALAWFARERDDRGWVEGAGWAHSVAHGADLMGAIGASRLLEEPQLCVLLDVLAERLAVTTEYLHAGEDDRLALAVLTIAQRGKLMPIETLDAWLATRSRRSPWSVARLLSAMPARPRPPTTPTSCCAPSSSTCRSASRHDTRAA